MPGESSGRIRTLAKFVEKDYEKVNKLVQLRREYQSKISTVEEAITRERKALSEEEQEMMAAEWLSRRLDAGLFSLQVLISPHCTFEIISLTLYFVLDH